MTGTPRKYLDNSFFQFLALSTSRTPGNDLSCISSLCTRTLTVPFLTISGGGRIPSGGLHPHAAPDAACISAASPALSDFTKAPRRAPLHADPRALRSASPRRPHPFLPLTPRSRAQEGPGSSLSAPARPASPQGSASPSPGTAPCPPCPGAHTQPPPAQMPKPCPYLPRCPHPVHTCPDAQALPHLPRCPHPVHTCPGVQTSPHLPRGPHPASVCSCLFPLPPPRGLGDGPQRGRQSVPSCDSTPDHSPQGSSHLKGRPGPLPWVEPKNVAS